MLVQNAQMKYILNCLITFVTRVWIPNFFFLQLFSMYRVKSWSEYPVRVWYSEVDTVHVQARRGQRVKLFILITSHFV